MKIGFIGTGSMAGALAAKWCQKHKLFFGGRNVEKAKLLAGTCGGASGTLREAVAFGDVIVLAIHAGIALETVAGVGSDAFSGKTLIDITNPIDTVTFRSTLRDGSMTTALAAALPIAHVGKAFNMAQASVWAAADLSIDGRAYVTLYTADEGAGDVIASLIRDVGSEPLCLGDNGSAYQLEAAAAIIIKFLFAGRDSNTVLQFIQPEKQPVR